MFNNAKDILTICKNNNKKIWQVHLEKEIKESNTSKENIFNYLKEVLKVMEESTEKGLDKEINSMGGLIGSEAMKIEKYKKENTSFSSKFMLSAVARAFSTSQVNACMGRIVAAPTAGAAGILPAIMFSTKDKLNLTENEMVHGLLTASAIGEIIATKATISGAEGGCQAECGAAAAMSAAAIVEMAGGTAEQSFHAASFALTNIMGLVCDPIAGLVEYPCSLRNASGVTNAFLSADLALANIESIIPFDEVVEALYEVGNQMHFSLKETALGGLATTKTGNKIKEDLLNK